MHVKAPAVIRRGLDDEEEWIDRQVVHESLADDRDCSTCTCGTAEGDCTGTVRLANTHCGTQLEEVQNLTIGAACVAVGFLVESGSFASAAAPSNPSCPPSQSTPIGTVEPAGPITLCCDG